MAKKISWIDSGREPRARSDPAYPDGIDLDLSRGKSPACDVKLPYPAKRCGQYLIMCETCPQVIMVTTAGRRDDPRSVKMLCMPKIKELVKR